MKLILRIRVNGRLPDPQNKYRDEITQEATMEMEYEEGLTDVLLSKAQERMDEIKDEFYKELNRMGGKNYAKV